MKERAEKVRERLGVDVPLDIPIEKLGAGAQQLVEIMRATSTQPKILILDEPTASLEKERLSRF